MTKDWDFYFLRVNDVLASIYVDLGIQANAPVAALPHLAYIRLHLNLPRDDGLSSQAEYKQLIAIEDALEAALCSSEVGYVGRCTSAGSRDFYFYISSPDSWSSHVDRAMSTFPAYQYQVITEPDAGWTTYTEFLFPGPRDRQRMENRHVCEALEKNGDKLVVAREIDHWSYFPSAEAAQAFIADVTTAGFQVRASRVLDEGANRHVVCLWRSDVPSFDNIDSVTLPLFEAAERHGGDYDGWECPVEVDQ